MSSLRRSGRSRLPDVDAESDDARRKRKRTSSASPGVTDASADSEDRSRTSTRKIIVKTRRTEEPTTGGDVDRRPQENGVEQTSNGATLDGHLDLKMESDDENPSDATQDDLVLDQADKEKLTVVIKA